MSDLVLNHNQMRQRNRRTVLDLLRRKGATSRIEITQTLRCDGTTVTNLIRDLLAKGIVRSTGFNTTAGAGRPREMIELNGDFRQAIGLSFDSHSMIGTVVTLRGEIMVREQVYLRSDVSQKELLTIVDQLVGRLLDRCEKDKLLGIGIATIGLLLPDEKIITQSAHFPALEGIDFNAHFLKTFNIRPTIIDGTFAKSLAEIEMRKRTTGSPLDFLLLEMGVGIGCAIVRRGELLYGASGYVSEFGHMVFEMEGDMCQCGHKGCLETLASIPAIEARVAKALQGKPIGFDAIVEQYQAETPEVVDAVNVAARWMGVGIANLVNFINPTEIVLSGHLLKLGKPYLDVVRATVQEFSLAPFFKNLNIVTSSLESEGAATGVTELLLEAFFDNLDTKASPVAVEGN